MANRKDRNPNRRDQNKDRKPGKARSTSSRKQRRNRKQRKVSDSSRQDNKKQSNKRRDSGNKTSGRKTDTIKQKSDFFKSNTNIPDDVKTTSKSSGRASNKKMSNKMKPRGKSRRGILLVSAFILLLLIYYSTVLYEVQIKKHEEMSELANHQYYRKMTTAPKRGDILDRNGKVLATTTNIYRIGVTPKHVYSLLQSQTQDEIAENFAGILDLDLSEIKNELEKKDELYIQIAKNISQEKTDLLKRYLDAHQIGGVRLDAEPKRIFLNENIASQVIGFSSLNGDILEGRLGIEYEMDSVLSGQAGFSFGARDNYSYSGLLPFSESTEQSTKDGYNVQLTLDYQINKKLQEHVERAVKSLNAKEGGMGLVLNVNTGEVLGMASYPYFYSSDPSAEPLDLVYEDEWDPTDQDAIDFLMENVWRNRVISDVFEVGSTFKILTLAMGLEENITTEEKIYSDDPIDILDYTIKCWSGSGHGDETLADAFKNSCNPPFVQVALDLGTEKFYEYVDAFGFTKLSGIQLPGEAANIFHENPSPIDTATLAFGEQSGLNLMSYSKGLSSAVNGGNLMTPSIIKQITDQQGRIVSNFESQIERRVLSESTSDRVNNLLSRNDLMQGINKASVGYALGGKTSTSVNEFTEELTMSYASFAPIDNPEIMVIIVAQSVDNSTFSDSLINNVSGLVDWILDYMNVQRNYTEKSIQNMQDTVALTELYGRTLEDAMYSLTYESIIVVPGTDDMKADDLILNMVPAPGTELHRGSKIYVYPQAEIEEDLVSVPNFSGKNYSECMIEADAAGLIVKFEGDYRGLAVEQSIAASDDLAMDLIDGLEDNVEIDPFLDEENNHNELESEEGTMTDFNEKLKQTLVQRGTIIKITLQLDPDQK